MQLKFNYLSTIILFIMLWFISVNSRAQNMDSVTLNIGDPAPPLQVSTWLKGTPFQTFETGKLYAIEFWATWCKPCIAAMPKLSAFARKHRGDIEIVSIAVYEAKTPIEKIKKIVDSMGNRMDYSVAVDEDAQIENKWLKACGDGSIPKIMVVNGRGAIAWIGDPQYFEQVATKIIHQQWNIHQALYERNISFHIKRLTDSLYHELRNFMGNEDIVNENKDLNIPLRKEQPDSILAYINHFIEKEPQLKYEPLVVDYTLYVLLQTNVPAALEYGKKALQSANAAAIASSIVYNIKNYKTPQKLPTAMYALGAEAYQLYIHQFPYPELASLPKYYEEMAEWYWRAKNKTKSIASAEKAITSLKEHPDFSPAVLHTYESKLEWYQKAVVQ